MKHAAQVAIIGAGIVGLATAWQLVRRGIRDVLVLEAAERIASHQTGHNSGVIHSGIYYKPGSVKALNCTRGRDQLYQFCAEYGIAHERCGKVIVATKPQQLPALHTIVQRGTANGLTGLRLLCSSALRDIEPHVAGIAGVYVPQTGIVDYPAVAHRLVELITTAGGQLRCNQRVVGVAEDGAGFRLIMTDAEVRCRAIINCAGLHSDRVARLCGLEPDVQIIPFRGEYYTLRPERAHLVRNLIYPVADPRLPFLGVHFTRMIHGGIEAGPNAVLALAREGYRWRDVNSGDLIEMLRYSGAWRLFARFWKTGVQEVRRSLSKWLFWRSLQELVPAVQLCDLRPGEAGVRAQAVGRDGRMIDDFVIRSGNHMLHVLNAPSPAATACLSIGEVIATRAAAEFNLH
jgi:L-2-hydroxyglutarate oxidase